MSGRSTCPQPTRWLSSLLLALVAAVALASGASAQNVMTYHNTPDRAGRYVTPGLTWAQAANVVADTAFQGTITGNVYAQPLYWQKPGLTHGWVIVATESNMVYALQAVTGQVMWQRSLGTPVTGGLPCGNINPVGVTGTPVIDPLTNTLYLDALIDGTQGPHHQIFAIELATGKVLPGWPVNVQNSLSALGRGFNVTAQGERGALTIAKGKLFVPYGGLDGDCSTYHGAIVQLTLGQPKITDFWRTRAMGGGIWAQSGIAFDGQSMFVGTGNTRGTTTWGDGEAVIRVAPGLPHYSGAMNFFTPSGWHDLDNRDKDLAGTGPIPIVVPGNGGATLTRVLALGKDGYAYLLDRNNLGGIGGQLATSLVSTGEIITAPAWFYTATGAMVAFGGAGAACPTGQSGNLTMLRIGSDPTTPIATAWCAPLNGQGAPVVTTTDGAANPIVWVAGAQGDNQLHAFRGTDGTPLASVPGLSGLQRNTTILAAEGRLYVAGSGRVFAFTY